MKYLKQLLYDMRNQRMMTWVSISGTAVSIFLVMVFFMANNLSTVSVAPELDRQLIYVGQYVDLQGISDNWSYSGAFSLAGGKKLYEDLEGVEKTSFISSWNSPCNVMTGSKPPLNFTGKKVDGNFWDIYKFDFIDGRPFSDEECLATTPGVILSEKVARKLFGTTDIVGHEINISGNSHIIYGVVRNVSPILKTSWADIYLTLDTKERTETSGPENNGFLGNLMAVLKYAPDTDPAKVKEQVMSRYATINSELEKRDMRLEYHGSPFDAESVAAEIYSNSAPHVKSEHRMQYLIYALLILLPAINLSSMTRGRLRHRVSEIGVRRAFGARRSDIIYQLLGENFIVSLAGGMIGLLFSYFFMLFLSSEFFTMTDRWSTSVETLTATPTFEMLFTWKSFLVSLGACFILNILTATVPAWKAASISPSQAISKSKI